MIAKIFKRIVRKVFNSYGYDIVNQRQFGEDILNDIDTIIKPNPKSVLFDIGANLGQTTQEFSNKYKESLIYSFEPDPAAFNQLNKNLVGRKNIQTFNIGFGDSIEKIKMNINKASGGNSILSVSDNIREFARGDWTVSVDQREVDITTLDAFCAAQKLSHIDLVKIDTQGYEAKILNGAAKVITPSFTRAIYIEVLFVELYKEQAYFKDIYRMLTERGYRLVGLYNNFRKQESPHFLLWCDALFVAETNESSVNGK